MDKQQPRPSQEDPGLQTVGGWKDVRRSAAFACLAPLLSHRPQLLAPAGDTILGWDVMTLLSSHSLSEVHRQFLFSLRSFSYTRIQLKTAANAALLHAVGCQRTLKFLQVRSDSGHYMQSVSWIVPSVVSLMTKQCGSSSCSWWLS